MFEPCSDEHLEPTQVGELGSSADLHALAGLEAVTSPFVCLKRLGGQTHFEDKHES
jgi:hypothetical protein